MGTPALVSSNGDFHTVLKHLWGFKGVLVGSPQSESREAGGLEPIPILRQLCFHLLSHVEVRLRFLYKKGFCWVFLKTVNTSISSAPHTCTNYLLWVTIDLTADARGQQGGDRGRQPLLQLASWLLFVGNMFRYQVTQKAGTWTF